LGSIQWLHEQDLCPDTLYLESEKKSWSVPGTHLFTYWKLRHLLLS
jgi:hypothetical protein